MSDIHLSGLRETSPLRNGEALINDLAMDLIRKKNAWLEGEIKKLLPAEVVAKVHTNPGLAKTLLDELNVHTVEKPGVTELWQDKVKLSEFRIVYKPL